MRVGVWFRGGALAGLAALAAALQGQQTQSQDPPIVIFRIDLDPTGSAFAANEPTLEGDTYVFRILPEKTIVRLPKAKVKAVTRWTTDFEKEVVYQLDLAPTGVLLAREEPVKKGTNYTVKTWKQGTLVSLPEADVLKVTKLTGMTAFKAEQVALGAVLLTGEQTSASPGSQQGSSAGSSPAPPGQAVGSGNWTYQGKPGATDAYAPGNATVARPGDTPMAPEPTRPPR
jgi:hypothetical protein